MLVIKIPETEDGSRIDRCIRRILGNINQAMLEKYLRSGLILLDNKIIEKIRLDNRFIENNEKNVQKRVRDYFTAKLKPKKEKVRISKNKRKQAASDIMEEFNL